MNHHTLVTLLLIDDCAEDRVIFRHFLHHDSWYTYRIVEFETVTEALAWCQQQRPDVILLDYLLPDGDGLEFIELLRGELRNDQSAVIMLTGEGDEIIAVRAMKTGAQDYLIKNTLTPEILQGAIRHAVEEMHLIKQLQQSQEQQQLMASIALRIRQSLQLQEILTATATEVRQFLQADRVIVYQFHPDMSGTVVAESVLGGWRVSLGTQIQDTCFQQGAGADYHLGKKRAIDNIYQAGLTDCHLQLLEEFEVKANLVVPILVNNQLWGLLIAHQCGASRHWQTVELDLLDQLGVQIAIAIQQASAYEQLQAELAERQRVQESLLESEERFRCTFEQAAVGISHVSLNGQFIRLNQRFCEITGYSQAELQTLTFQEITHPDDLAADLEQVQKLLAGEIDTYSIEKRYIRKNGEYVWINLTVSLVRDRSGEPKYFISVIQDITPRKQVEAALRQKDERLNMALEAAAMGTWDWNIQTGEITWSPSLEILFGITPGTFNGKYETVVAMMHPDDRQSVLQAINRAVYERLEYNIEFRFIKPDGTVRWALGKGRVFYDHKGQPIQMMGVDLDITERKQGEAYIRESEERFREMADTAPVLIWMSGTDKLCYYFNKTWLDFTGRTLEQERGHAWAEGVHPDDFQDCLDTYLNGFDARQNFQMEYRLQRFDGEYRWILDTGIPRFTRDGDFLGYIGSCIDITERIHAQQALQQLNQELEARVEQRTQALRESEERWQLALRGTNDGIWDWNVKTNQVFYSTRWKEIRGFAEDEISSSLEEWSRRIHPDDYQWVMQSFTDHCAQKTPFFQAEYRVQCKDGSYIWVLDRGQALWDGAGNVIRVTGSETDITNRKQAEEQLRNLSARLTLALKAAAIGIWDWDMIHAAQWDDRMYELYDLPRSDSLATYQSWLDSLHPEDRVAAEAAFEAAVRGEKEFDTEFRIIHRDDSIHFIKAAAIVQRNQYGQPQRMVGINYEITERKHTEAQLRQTNEQLCQTNAQLARVTRLKDEFLANMSHELRTPLNAILGMSEGLNEGVFGDINERQKKAISTIERSGKHLLELINDILDLSKIESGKVELQLSEVSVRSVCDASLAFVRQMALKKNIRLTTRISAHLGSIQADERRLRQVLINLLSNAIKFTPEAGSVFLEVRLETPENPINPPIPPSPHLPISPSPHLPIPPFPLLTLSVTDTGIGISAEDLKKLFQPFVQVDSSLNRQYEGTGLGLALVQRIVALHQGTVSVSSEPGKGSCFTVRIPYRTSDNFPKIEQTLPLPSHCLPKDNAQVLIIEDSTPASEQISRYLQSMGMEPIVYPRGEGAAFEVERLLPALVILDLQLPNLSGWEILHQIKTNPQTQTIPVLIISVIDERTTGLAQGAFEYLVKPISRNQLQAVIKKLQSPDCYDFAQEIVLPKPEEKSPLILLAEDNQANIDTMSGYLECRGYRLVLANNGQQAIDIALAQRPDLIIMDIQMPVMDGLEAIRYIRQEQQFSNVPIIALTALAMPGDRETCLCAGANEYLSKPIKLKQLAATIQQLLQR